MAAIDRRVLQRTELAAPEAETRGYGGTKEFAMNLFIPLAAMFLAMPAEITRVPPPVVCHESSAVCHEYLVDRPAVAPQVVSKAPDAP